MARFAVNEPIVGSEPVILVDAGLPVGRHRFRLEVVDTAGRRSAPDEAIVVVRQIVVPPGGPPVGPVGPPIVDPIPRPTPIGPTPIGPTPIVGPRRTRPDRGGQPGGPRGRSRGTRGRSPGPADGPEE
jgi:hypothetical protein